MKDYEKYREERMTTFDDLPEEIANDYDNPKGYYEYNRRTKEWEFHCREWDEVDDKLDQVWLERWEENESED